MIYTESNFDKAIYCYKESIKIDNSAQALCNVGNLLYLKGEIKEAEKFTKLAIKKKKICLKKRIYLISEETNYHMD